ncbi:uncharacterized protein F4807DRAFT_472611 [Annulohypoxylon truncatum]|uniref:uncharacterized protein n=1 Tax=Annulohypoxylon truncatum TaxID=327061 RepID=UPI002008BC3B|nr:uncharacterized protein F4807DRAFT_472611 [Annulohypoxylon truncatum]KAI1212411.1 hypothetical protein F4807DRAFT_472611 [Annulohypoxylon truncatum]
MAPDTKEYDVLQRQSTEWSDEEPESSSSTRHVNPWKSSITLVTAIFLAFSLAVNVLLSMRPFLTSTSQGDCRSEFAGLQRDVPVQIYQSTEYTSDNITAVTELWERLSGDPGVVALSQNYVQEKRLPHALRFPWDEDKGVYLLQGFHDLHCLRTLFRYVMYTDLGLPQRIAVSHALHCLDQLRQEVVCNANDAPRYAGFQDPPGTGAGQVRMCRDWHKLEKWALERTACFKHEDEVPGPMIERFKSCPDGRILWPSRDATDSDGA